MKNSEAFAMINHPLSKWVDVAVKDRKETGEIPRGGGLVTRSRNKAINNLVMLTDMNRVPHTKFDI